MPRYLPSPRLLFFLMRLIETNLAVVAPSIAEALLATAIGLVATIPAVIIYSHFARRINAYKGLVADASASVPCLCSRDLSRRDAGQIPAV